MSTDNALQNMHACSMHYIAYVVADLRARQGQDRSHFACQKHLTPPPLKLLSDLHVNHSKLSGAPRHCFQCDKCNYQALSGSGLLDC